MDIQKILVIDDDNLLRQTICMVLEDAGYAIEEAASGPEGIEKAKTFRPDYVFCDVRLGDMDGYETLQVLKEDAETASIPVVLMTGFTTEASRKKGEEAGAVAYLAKPFTVDKLLQLMEQLQAACALPSRS